MYYKSIHFWPNGEYAMSCKSCSSNSQAQFGSEIMIHFSGLVNLNKPAVMVFPKIAVCLECGFAEFTIPETELRLLGKGGKVTAA
jgi:hypothetical protein